jgi:hypothetical protein
VVESSAPKQRGRPFPKGVSGNPAGKPKRTRNRAIVLVESLLDADAEALAQAAIDLAKSGDVTALRLCLDRIAPPRRDRHVAFTLPPLDTATDALKATPALVEPVATGELTPSGAAEPSKLVEGFSRAVELHDIQQRLERLKAAQPRGGAMSKSVMARITRLESVEGGRQGAPLVASTEAEAETLRAMNPNGVIVITGVPRSSSRHGDAR